jgi:hypothetical protein
LCTAPNTCTCDSSHYGNECEFEGIKTKLCEPGFALTMNGVPLNNSDLNIVTDVKWVQVVSTQRWIAPLTIVVSNKALRNINYQVSGSCTQPGSNVITTVNQTFVSTGVLTPLISNLAVQPPSTSTTVTIILMEAKWANSDLPYLSTSNRKQSVSCSVAIVPQMEPTSVCSDYDAVVYGNVYNIAKRSSPSPTLANTVSIQVSFPTLDTCSVLSTSNVIAATNITAIQLEQQNIGKSSTSCDSCLRVDNGSWTTQIFTNENGTTFISASLPLKATLKNTQNFAGVFLPSLKCSDPRIIVSALPEEILLASGEQLTIDIQALVVNQTATSVGGAFLIDLDKNCVFSIKAIGPSVCWTDVLSQYPDKSFLIAGLAAPGTVQTNQSSIVALIIIIVILVLSFVAFVALVLLVMYRWRTRKWPFPKKNTRTVTQKQRAIFEEQDGDKVSLVQTLDNVCEICEKAEPKYKISVLPPRRRPSWESEPIFGSEQDDLPDMNDDHFVCTKKICFGFLKSQLPMDDVSRLRIYNMFEKQIEERDQFLLRMADRPIPKPRKSHITYSMFEKWDEPVAPDEDILNSHLYNSKIIPREFRDKKEPAPKVDEDFEDRDFPIDTLYGRKDPLVLGSDKRRRRK